MNNTIFKIDKTNWKPVKFGDVVAEPKETCKDIIAEGIEHVVGLEHIETGDLHLRKSATIEESTTFTKKFRKGDVLFGRRRAYLKKAAQADFDGICSGDITVFRAKKELSSELLPFIVNNDKFFDYAVKHSAGGLSPRVKFNDLANYEFLLPPKAEQARLAELLWAMDDVIEKEKEVLEALELSMKSIRKTDIENLSVEKIKIINLLENNSEVNVGKIEKSKYQLNGKYPIVDQSVDFIIGYTDDEKLVYDGTLPIIVFGDHTTILKFIDFPFVMGADGTKILKPKPNIDVKYFYQALKELNIQPQGYRRHYSILRNEKIKVPTDPKWIKQFMNKMDLLSNSIEVLNSKISASQSLQKSIINQIF